MVLTTGDGIDAAIGRATDPFPGFVATRVEHDAALNVMVFTLGSGRRLVIPVEDMQGLVHGTHEQLSHYELLGPGTAVYFPDLDADLYIEYLVKGSRGDRQWMCELAQRSGVDLSLAA